MHIMKKWLTARVWRHSAMAALLCTLVVVLNMLLGLIALKLFDSFWLGVALYAFTPVWLICYGLFFSSRWKWHELALGVWVALFAITLFDLRDADGMSYKMATGLFFSLTGAFAVTLGSLTATLARSITKDIRHSIQKRKLRKANRVQQGTQVKG
ncbi:MAG: hypothetical protein ACXVDJ_02150 [Tumebacillaceae bacterium]